MIINTPQVKLDKVIIEKLKSGEITLEDSGNRATISYDSYLRFSVLIEHPSGTFTGFAPMWFFESGDDTIRLGEESTKLLNDLRDGMQLEKEEDAIASAVSTALGKFSCVAN